MADEAALKAEILKQSLAGITESLRSFIELSLQDDDRIWEEWISAGAGKVEVRCWQKKNCQRTDCPAYQSESGRCWLLAGSLCGSAQEETPRPGPTNCCDCEIYQANVCRDYVSEIQEQIIILVHNLRARQLELKRMAIHDPLTGLKNRRFFDMYIHHEVERCRRNHEGMAVVVIDVDDFKEVNDSFGHIVGDNILKECATILEKSIRGTDLLFRFGGDEFFIIMSKAGDHEAQILIQRINNRLAVRNGVYEDNDLRISFSIGYALMTEKRELIEVICEADLRMYEDKRRRKEMAGLG